jgi:hypothetical protein
MNTSFTTRNSALTNLSKPCSALLPIQKRKHITIIIELILFYMQLIAKYGSEMAHANEP